MSEELRVPANNKEFNEYPREHYRALSAWFISLNTHNLIALGAISFVPEKDIDNDLAILDRKLGEP